MRLAFLSPVWLAPAAGMALWILILRRAAAAAGLAVMLGGLVAALFLRFGERPTGPYEFGMSPGSWTLLGGWAGALPAALQRRPFTIRRSLGVFIGAAFGFAVGFMWWLGTIIAR